MRSLIFARFFLAAFCVLTLSPLRAEEAKPEAPHTAPPAGVKGQASQLPAGSTAQHSITLDGKQLSYKAAADTLPLFGPKGEIAAKIFYVAYTAGNANERPVTFAFNGGPGAAAAFLHLGALGPRIVPFSENGAAPLRPARLADNPDSWLAFTDLVFIDPVGTGYSRTAAGGADAEKAYWGVAKDIDSMAEAVRLWLSQNGRELAPLYLAGESYGGFRVAGLSKRLLSMGFSVQGAVMVSPALEFSMLYDDDYTVLPLTFVLPSLAAANAEIQGGPRAPLDAVAEAEAYARADYLLHLANGLKQDREAIAAVAKFTGLEPDTVSKHHGRVSAELFRREYLRRTDRELSLYDAAVSTPAPRPSERPRFDPILDGAAAVLGPAASSYIGTELGFKTSLEYRLLNRKISAHWDFGLKPGQQGYAGSLGSLEEARMRNPALKILIVHGYTDLVTPFAMSGYLVSQLRPIEGAAPAGIRVYRGGHMMYLRPASRAELSRDARVVYGAAGAQ